MTPFERLAITFVAVGFFSLLLQPTTILGVIAAGILGFIVTTLADLIFYYFQGD